MKVRNGFVSNSSSSSFIVSFPSVPRNVGDVMEMMFPNSNESKIIKTFESFTSYNGLSYSNYDVASTVWKDIKKQGPNNYLKAVYEICDDQYSVWYDDISNVLQYTPTWKERDFEGYSSLEELEKDIEKNKEYEAKEENNWSNETDFQLESFEESIKEIKDFISLNPGVLYSFRYSDEDGEYGSILEHDDIFRNLPNERYSHH